MEELVEAEEPLLMVPQELGEQVETITEEMEVHPAAMEQVVAEVPVIIPRVELVQILQVAPVAQEVQIIVLI
jgi:hypothetical protein